MRSTVACSIRLCECVCACRQGVKIYPHIYINISSDTTKKYLYTQLHNSGATINASQIKGVKLSTPIWISRSSAKWLGKLNGFCDPTNFFFRRVSRIAKWKKKMHFILCSWSAALSLSFYKASVASSAFSLPSVLIAICGCVCAFCYFVVYYLILLRRICKASSKRA